MKKNLQIAGLVAFALIMAYSIIDACHRAAPIADYLTGKGDLIEIVTSYGILAMPFMFLAMAWFIAVEPKEFANY